MDFMPDSLPFLTVATFLLPAVTAFFIMVLPHKESARHLCTVGALLSFLASLGIMVVFADQGMESIHVPIFTMGSVEIIGFVFDRVSTILAPAFIGIGVLVSIYAHGYLTMLNREHPDPGLRRFYVFLVLFIGAMGGLVYSSTLIGQLVFFEITGACSWALIGYYDQEDSKRSANKALIITHIGSLGLYAAAAVLFMNTGTFEIAAIASLADGPKVFVLLAILMAAWSKSAQLPFYMWLPSAMKAPTPVSAYLHGASMVKVGVYVFARAVMSAGAIPEIVGWVGIIGAIITLIFSFIMYLPQVDMKRLLAFSTISQLSYVFIALSLAVFGSKMAFDGGIAHMFNHAFAKTLFFLVAGSLSYICGTRMLDRIRGLSKASPLLGVGFVCAALAISGVPPFNGFFSKFQIFAGGFEIGQDNWVVMLIMILVLIETLLCFAWFMKWIGSVVFGEPSEVLQDAQPLPKSMAFSLVVLIIMTVASSFIVSMWIG